MVDWRKILDKGTLIAGLADTAVTEIANRVNSQLEERNRDLERQVAALTADLDATSQERRELREEAERLRTETLRLKIELEDCRKAVQASPDPCRKT